MYRCFPLISLVTLDPHAVSLSRALSSTVISTRFPLVVISRSLVLKDDSLTIESFVNPKFTVDLFVFGYKSGGVKHYANSGGQLVRS